MLFILEMGSMAENITQPDFCYLVCQTNALVFSLAYTTRQNAYR